MIRIMNKMKIVGVNEETDDLQAKEITTEIVLDAPTIKRAVKTIVKAAIGGAIEAIDEMTGISWLARSSSSPGFFRGGLSAFALA